MSTRTPVSTERTSLGPAWKSEARGQWRRDFRRSGESSSTPIVLRIREARNAFAWEMWRGNQLVRSGESLSVADAATTVESAASGTAVAVGSEHLGAALDAAMASQADGGNAKVRGVLLGIVVVCWMLQLRAIWLGVASPAMLILTALATVGLYYQVQIRRVV